MAEDQPTAWELQRTLTAIRQELQNGLAQLNARLDRQVSTDVFAAHQQAIDRRITEVERDVTESLKRIEAEAEKRATDRRLVLGALVTALVPALVQIWLASKGLH